MGHDEALADDKFGGETRSFGIHFCNTVWGEPRCETVRCEDERTKRVNGNSVLGVRRMSRALQSRLGEW